jgi:hypothetical protein
MPAANGKVVAAGGAAEMSGTWLNRQVASQSCIVIRVQSFFEIQDTFWGEKTCACSTQLRFTVLKSGSCT